MLSLSLEEILPNGSMRLTNDGMIYAVDLVMLITSKNKNESAEVLRRLSDEIFSESKLVSRNTGGRGNSKTKLISFADALELIMVLPGKMAKETRSKFADIIRRYLAGDATLVKELADNAASSNAVHVLARESLAQDDNNIEDSRKRRRLMEELHIRERTEALETIRADRQTKLIQTYQSLCPNQILDDQARVMFKDQILNMAMGDYGPKKRLITVVEEASEEPIYENKPITVSTVASQMGVILKGTDAQKIGLKLKEMYFARYQRPPTKHEQMVGGAMREVNSYTERDKDMVRDAILAFLNKK